MRTGTVTSVEYRNGAYLTIIDGIDIIHIELGQHLKSIQNFNYVWTVVTKKWISKNRIAIVLNSHLGVQPHIGDVLEWITDGDNTLVQSNQEEITKKESAFTKTDLIELDVDADKEPITVREPIPEVISKQVLIDNNIQKQTSQNIKKQQRSSNKSKNGKK